MRKGRREFRANWGIRWAALGALVMWLAVGGTAVWLGGLPASAFVSIGFFVVFFLGFVTYYWKMRYVVDEFGVTYRGATDHIHFKWEDIDEVRDSELPLGGCYVATRRGGFMLSTFVRGRDELVDLIVARAGLFPS